MLKQNLEAAALFCAVAFTASMAQTTVSGYAKDL
jgi:hypothetical protein